MPPLLAPPQLAMQLACAAVSRLSVTGIPLESLCVSLPPDLAVFIPGMGKVTLVCLWELVNTCFFLSGEPAQQGMRCGAVGGGGVDPGVPLGTGQHMLLPAG